MAVSWLEPSKLGQGILPREVARTTNGQSQGGTIVGAAKLGRRQQDFVPEGLKSGMRELWRQTKAPEPVDKVVGQQEQVEVGLVGEEVTGGNAAKGVVPLELLDQQLDAGAIVVEAPEVQGLQGQVGHQDLIVI